jgi:Rod binding domain-containing protein
VSSSILGGSLAAQAQTSLLQTRETNMLQQLKNQQGQGSDAKIDKSAQEFESMLLSTWLQQAESSMATVPGAEDDEDAGAREQMMSLGVQSLSNAMAASGGIGIGKMIAKSLHASAAKTEGAAPASAGPNLPSVATPAASPVTIPAEKVKIAK